jgi:cyclic beta-1,2-glucan synthetase
VYQEWLRDNYYLLEREGRAVLRELRKTRAPWRALARMAGLCRELCPQGRVPEEQALCQALLGARCSSQEVALLPLALRLTLVRAAADSVRAPSPEEKVALIRGAVTSLRALPDLDFAALTEQASPLERCLRRDPAGVFPQMEEGSRAVYRHLLQRLAQRRRQSAEDCARDLIASAAGAREGDPARHIGVPLLEQSRHAARGRALLITETLLPPAIALALAFALRAWYLFPLLCLPLCALCRVCLEALFLRGVEPIPLPRLELGGRVPEEGRTLIAVSTLLVALVNLIGAKLRPVE